MSDETRNIIDHYHYWKHEAILADLDSRRHNFSVLCSNLYNDYNIACVIRCANAFLAQRVYIYGRRKYDKRGTVGTHKYEHIETLPDKSALNETLDKFSLIAFDNIEGATPIEDFKWPANPLLAFGQEQVGLPPEILSRATHKVYIRQYGSVRSLNVACAAAIAMQDWCVKNAS